MKHIKLDIMTDGKCGVASLFSYKAKKGYKPVAVAIRHVLTLLDILDPQLADVVRRTGFYLQAEFQM